ncbi:hypothetical protein GQX74_008854 [Glossina fuscipes]|nr:hypothetical protein GQX74_008854 [Glossina fuscipes]
MNSAKLRLRVFTFSLESFDGTNASKSQRTATKINESIFESTNGLTAVTPKEKSRRTRHSQVFSSNFRFCPDNVSRNKMGLNLYHGHTCKIAKNMQSRQNWCDMSTTGIDITSHQIGLKQMYDIER